MLVRSSVIEQIVGGATEVHLWSIWNCRGRAESQHPQTTFYHAAYPVLAHSAASLSTILEQDVSVARDIKGVEEDKERDEPHLRHRLF